MTKWFLVFRKNEEVVIAVVICGNRTSEALVMIKSAIVFRGKSDLKIVVVAEKKIQQEFDETVSTYLGLLLDTYFYILYSSYFSYVIGNC